MCADRLWRLLGGEGVPPAYRAWAEEVRGQLRAAKPDVQLRDDMTALECVVAIGSKRPTLYWLAVELCGLARLGGCPGAVHYTEVTHEWLLKERQRSEQRSRAD